MWHVSFFSLALEFVAAQSRIMRQCAGCHPCLKPIIHHESDKVLDWPKECGFILVLSKSTDFIRAVCTRSSIAPSTYEGSSSIKSAKRVLGDWVVNKRLELPCVIRDNLTRFKSHPFGDFFESRLLSVIDWIDLEMKRHTQLGDANESRVLVVYTGGTIGMLSGEKGYSPLPGYLSEHLRSQPRFHDPASKSLCSNSRSVDAFRSWQSLVSLTSPPSSSSTASSLKTSPRSQPLSSSEDEANHSHGNQLKVNTETGIKWFDCLVMPECQEHAKIRYVVLEYEKLIDSSEIETWDYLKICHSIRSNYHLFDGFVILHGTDTMSYTASALSFLLENLGKSVILTGAQVPLSCPRNDAVENLLGALQIAGTYLIPEVSLYFNHCLWRGNRTVKFSSVGFDAFKSWNFEPLVKVGCNVEVRWDLISKPVERQPFRVHNAMCENVAVLRMFPSITPASVRAFLASPIQGIVLETFGAGNAPRKPELLKAFKEAADRGVVILNVTQCAKGTVSSDLYETGRTLAEVGIIGGRDMTTECALAKLGYLLSKPELTPEKIRNLLREPLRGELTPPVRAQFEPQPLEDRLSWLVKKMTYLQALNFPSSYPPLKTFPPELLVETATGSTAQESGSTYQIVGVDLASSESFQAEQDHAERRLLPLLLSSAASREEPILKQLLEISGGQIEAYGLLNHRSPAGLGQTALHLAAFHGRLANVELLLDHGASVHVRDDCGHTALYYAMIKRHKLCVDVLKKAGAHLADFEICDSPIWLETDEPYYS
ncbi:hypothetical protein O181_021772 [Austropuccinia psidii MF-1]|uniref:asparaginase n=1 Tax=Austropuccinia psidii MF-1 TaxID=1389203 RepID=A0A9Q3CG61_9BASI|nr:hypothetical protein [Austropuccinia psidii MF-1]